MAKKNRIQQVWSEPRKIFVESYLTKKGKRLMKHVQTEKNNGNLTQKEYEVWVKKIKAKYLKNRYKVNPNTRIIKTIRHAN